MRLRCVPFAFAIAIVASVQAHRASAQTAESDTLYREDAARKRAAVEAPLTPTIHYDIAPLPPQHIPHAWVRARLLHFRATPAHPASALDPDAHTFAARRDHEQFDLADLAFDLDLDAPATSPIPGDGGPYFAPMPVLHRAPQRARQPVLFAGDALPYGWDPDEPTDTRRMNPFYVSEEASVLSAAVFWFLRKPSRNVVLLPTIGGGRVGLVLAGPLDHDHKR